MSSCGVGLKNKQVLSQRLTLEWGGDEKGYYFNWNMKSDREPVVKESGEPPWGQQEWSERRPWGWEGSALCLVRTKGGEGTWLGLESCELEAEWMGANKPCSQRARAEYGFLPLRLPFKSSGLRSLQMFLGGDFMGWERSSLCAACFSLVVLNWV